MKSRRGSENEQEGEQKREQEEDIKEEENILRGEEKKRNVSCAMTHIEHLQLDEISNPIGKAVQFIRVELRKMRTKEKKRGK